MCETERRLVVGVVGVLIATTAACTCVKARNLTPAAGTQLITHRNVEVRAATLPNGSPSPLAVKDYCPTDVIAQKIVVGWSETNTGQAEYASITFPQPDFGEGPRSVEVKLCHYKSCRLEAFDASGVQVASAEHTAGQNVNQTLTVDGGPIRRIDIIGAEIGISSVCWSD